MVLFLKVFFLTGAVFALGMGLYSFFVYSLVLHNLPLLLMSFTKGSFLGGGFGFLMSIVLVPAHFYFFKKMIVPGLRPVELNARQSCVVFITADYDHVFESSLGILKKIEGLSIKSAERNTGLIEAKTKRSLKSYGEHLKLKLKDLKEENKVSIKISSTPLRAMTILDYGKNYENVKKYCQALNVTFIGESVNINFEKDAKSE